MKKEFDQADKEIKERVKGRPLVIAGDYEITSTEVSRKGYMVDPSTYWNVKIKHL